MPNISIIIPIHNVAKYLDKSIQSVLDQTHGNFELILVNDGSTDNSGAICDKYQLSDNRIKVIHQKNAGSGYARNSGLNIASGDYIYFMDPDDYIDPNLIEDNLYFARKNNANIVVFGYYREKIGKNEKVTVEEIPDIPDMITNTDFKNNFANFINYSPYYLWNKFYKHDYLKQTNCRFTNQIVGQDALFNIDLYGTDISKIFVNKKCYYHYIFREGSAVNKYQPKRFECEYNIAIKLEELIGKLKIDKNLANDIINKSYLRAFVLQMKSLHLKDCDIDSSQKLEYISFMINDEKIAKALETLQ